MNENNNTLVVIFGSGGHSQVLINSLNSMGRKILGIVDPVLEGQKNFLSIPVIKESDFLENKISEEFEVVNGVGKMPGNNNREILSRKLRKANYKLATIIDSNACIASNVEIDEGAQIMAGAVIQPNVKIGQDSIINTSSSVDHDCRIGKNCHIAPGVTMSGNVLIGDNCHIGTGSIILNDIVIYDNCIIAGGSTVFEDMPPNTKLIQKK